MPVPGFDKRFLESTRGQIVALLRRRAHTVEELAQALALTDNAIRSHLTALERDGLVRQDGVRRGQGVGKPAIIYELSPETEPLFSHAYPPVLSALLDVLAEELPAEQADAILREVGRRLAHSAGGRSAGDLEARARAAAAVLTALGGAVELARADGTLRIQGFGCPLSAAVAHRPELCRAVATLVAEVTGAPARDCCDRGERPRCCFEITSAA